VRRFLKRFCWFFVWGAWLWLGVGLHRELPRELGPPLGVLPLDRGDHLVGFIKSDGLVVADEAALGDQRRLNVYDVDAARLRHRLQGPLVWNGGKVPDWHGLAIGLGRGEDGSSQSMQAIDLRTGDRRRLGPASWTVLAVHPSKPLVAFKDRSWNENRPFVFIIDVQTCERVCEWTDRQDDLRGVAFPNGQFLGNDDFLVFGTRQLDGGRRRVHHLVHVSVGKGELGRLAIDQPRAAVHLPMRGGRFVLQRAEGDGGVVEVVEFPTGRVLFSSANLSPELRQASAADWNSIPKLSPSGRSLFTWEGKLWDVAEGRLLWAPSKIDVVVQRDPPGDVFAVDESWSPVWEWFRIQRNTATTAVRSLETGRVLYRYWGDADLECVSSDCLRAVDRSGSVYELPLRADWPLLAFCQVVLGTPILSVWLVFWRRRRRLQRLALV
jgi:hypothetical protein